MGITVVEASHQTMEPSRHTLCIKLPWSNYRIAVTHWSSIEVRQAGDYQPLAVFITPGKPRLRRLIMNPHDDMEHPDGRVDRRTFLKAGALIGAGMVAPFSVPLIGSRPAIAAVPGGTLDPSAIPRYILPLVIPPAMPPASTAGDVDYYEIAVRQFRQQILPGSMPSTRVWSYGAVNAPGTFNYPAFTIEARYNRPVRVKWINDLRDPATGKYLPHLLPVDQTLHWANPAGGISGRDTRPTFTRTPEPYRGPVPIVTHVHGAHTTEESDGYAEAWYLPGGTVNIPASYARVGSWHDRFRAKAEATLGVPWQPGSAVMEYPNDQRATTLWYHDHTLGMTRLNVYAGPAGFYLLRGGPNADRSKRRPGPRTR
jgi:spore coat protein A, manganese oxidase